MWGSAKDFGTSYCFVAGTLVTTEDGQEPIEEIEVGDRVLSENELTGEVAVKTVTETYINETDELIHIGVNGETISATPTHPFYVDKLGWTLARSLRAGDVLVLSNGELVTVEFVQHEILESPIKVYNFEVQDFHTYFVGECGVLVHNNCKSVDGGVGYDTFDDAKKALGSPGEDKAWHHIVEQNQIKKSGLSSQDIHNTKNLVSIDSGYSGSVHSKISGYYSSKQSFTNGQTVRSWLAGQDFDTQFEFGKKVLEQYGTLTPTKTGWIFNQFV